MDCWKQNNKSVLWTSAKRRLIFVFNCYTLAHKSFLIWWFLSFFGKSKQGGFSTTQSAPPSLSGLQAHRRLLALLRHARHLRALDEARSHDAGRLLEVARLVSRGRFGLFCCFLKMWVILKWDFFTTVLFFFFQESFCWGLFHPPDITTILVGVEKTSRFSGLWNIPWHEIIIKCWCCGRPSVWK